MSAARNVAPEPHGLNEFIRPALAPVLPIACFKAVATGNLIISLF